MAYRMALGHPHVVERLVVMDVVPTGEAWWRADAAFARAYWHWAILAHPAPLPERLIGADPQAFLICTSAMVWASAGPFTAIPPRCCSPTARHCTISTVEAMCEDYRAGATVDVDHDQADRGAGRQITCPVLVVWADRGGLARFYDGVLAVWRPWAPRVKGEAIASTHFMAEERPHDAAAALLRFV